MSWYDQRPLFGKRILVTRSARQQGTLSQLLKEAGATVINHASMEIAATDRTDELDRAIGQLAATQWLAFTSQNGVQFFFQRLFALQKDVRMLAHCKIAAVGPATAGALERYGLRADCVPTTYDAEHLAETLSESEPGTVLLPQADNARPLLRDALTAAGFQVQAVECYRSVTTANSLDVRTLDLDAVTFASSVTVTRFLQQLDTSGLEYLQQQNCAFIAIGEQTAAAMRANQVPVTAIADESTLPGLVQACIDVLSGK
jgi:uroporphyrinogen III methyltransferase/synthase